MAAIDQGWRRRASGVPIGGLGRRVQREARLAEPSTKVCQPAIRSAERAIHPRDAHPKTLTALNTSLSAASESRPPRDKAGSTQRRNTDGLLEASSVRLIRHRRHERAGAGGEPDTSENRLRNERLR
jgi:hypothetical protein